MTLHAIDNISARPFRVVQWATGNIGTRSLRAVIEHTTLELVGVYVHSEGKVGVDAGELCGLPATGIRATNSIHDVLASTPDCVLYMPNRFDPDEVCRLLAAGINVVTTRSEILRPASVDRDVRARIESACEQGRSSIHSTGISPGFITEALPLVLTSIQRRLDGLVIEEFGNLAHRNSHDLLFNTMGFGRLPKDFDPNRLTHAKNTFGPSLWLTADALGLPLDSIEASGEISTTPHDVEIAAGTLRAGSVAAQRLSAVGMRNGRPLITFRSSWYCATEFEPQWDVRSTGWRVTVEGDAPLEVDMRFPIAPEQMAETSPGYTANRAVNTVPFVCAALPGIRPSTELPQVIADLS